MKSFYVILLSVCFALFITIESRSAPKVYTENLTNGQKNQNSCGNITNLDMEFKDNINKTVEGMTEQQIKDFKNQFGCFLACFFQEQGLMNGTVLNAEKLIDLIKMTVDSSEETTPRLQNELDMSIALVRDCAKQVEHMTDRCLVAWTFGMCGGQFFGV